MDQALNNMQVQSSNDKVEVITDEEVNNSQNNFVPIEQMLNVEQNNNVVTQSNEQTLENNVVKEKKKDKVLRIQIFLIILWAVLTAVIYFFGYDLFEPFIKV